MITRLRFFFCYVGGQNELDLRRMLLMDNQQTIELFFKNRLVTTVWTKDDSMTGKGGGGTIKTNRKASVNVYDGSCFDE